MTTRWKWERSSLWVWAVCALARLAAFPVIAHAQTPSTTLTWTAPGDDASIGKATSYEARYSTSRPDTATVATFNAWWSAATPIMGMPTPLVAGSTQSVIVAPSGGFPSGVKIYFVIRSLDEVPNYSTLSNVAWRDFIDFVPPSPIMDLH